MGLWFYVVLGISWIFFMCFIVWCFHSAEENRREQRKEFITNRRVITERYLQEDQ